MSAFGESFHSLRCSSFLCVYVSLMLVIEIFLILVILKISNIQRKLSFDERKSANQVSHLFPLLNSQVILTYLVSVCVCVCVCLKDVYIVNNAPD